MLPIKIVHISDSTDIRLEMSVLIVASLFLVTVYIVHFYWKVRKYPKGPFPLPLIGNLLQVLIQFQIICNFIVYFSVSR